MTQRGRAGEPARFADLTLARLPKSADEARRVAEYGIRSVTLTRESASETAVRGMDWRTVGVVHFATHALIDAEGQSRTALALTPTASDDGFLTPSEIADAPLQRRARRALRVPIARRTDPRRRRLARAHRARCSRRGRGRSSSRTGRSAIAACCRSSIAFMRRWRPARVVGDALRQAKLAAIRDGARISDWAAFTVIGDASMRPSFRQRRLSTDDWLHDLIQPTRRPSAVARR